MTVFHLEISGHHGQFGETAHAEGLVIAAALHQVAQHIGSGRHTGDGNMPETITVNNVRVGHFWVGERSHRAAHQRAAESVGAAGHKNKSKGRAAIIDAALAHAAATGSAALAHTWGGLGHGEQAVARSNYLKVHKPAADAVDRAKSNEGAS